MKHCTIQSKLDEAFKMYSNNIAIEYCNKAISYKELDTKSTSIADFIKSKDIKKGTFIAILVDDRLELIATIIGILKAGCVFIPLDTAYPAERLENMIMTTYTKYVFTDNANHSKLSNLYCNTEVAAHVMNIEDTCLNKSYSACELTEYKPEDMIYVYFTSGSTGKPKALVGKNKSLLHFINWEIETFRLDEAFCISQLTSPSFDASLRDIFVPLCSGGKLCIPENRETVLDSKSLTAWIERSEINLIHCSPSLFKLIDANSLTSENFKKLKFILMAGESIRPKDLEHWYGIFGERIQLVNLYGSTETTLIKLFYMIRQSDVERNIIPIGKAISGARVIILDKNLQICNQGETGDIYIRTPYMTYGYFKNPELNSEKFIQNPFNNDVNDIIYKTGDLGRFLEDGNIEFLGRDDRQVKIRGIRIELGEIENTLLQCDLVKDAAVVLREDVSSQKYLCGYIVNKSANDLINKTDEDKLISDIRDFLKERVPEYMIPRYIIRIPKMPINPNGKLDYKNLPEPDQCCIEYEPPKNIIEAQLQKIWCDELGIDMIGVNESFIKIGGNSLNVMNVISKIYQKFGVELPLGEMFDNGTIEKLAAYIKKSGEGDYLQINPVEKRDYYPVSSAQRRLLILDKMEDLGTSYNIPFVMLVNGLIDIDRFETTLKSVLKRHEVLRTSFDFINDEPVQIISENVEFTLNYEHLQGYDNSDDKINKAIEKYVYPFNLSVSPLFRVGIVRLGEDKHILVFDMHHIISDDITMKILIEDFANIYKGKVLPELELQYKDYALWQNEILEKEYIHRQEEYWLKVFDGVIPILNMPTDYPRPVARCFEGDSVSIYFEKSICEGLELLVRSTGCTLFMVLIAAYYILLYKYTGQEDIVVGTPTAGRPHADLQGIAGMFSNTIALRNYPKNELTFMEFLNAVKMNVLAAYENQDYQFEKLVSKLGINRNSGRNPLFDTVFTIKNMDDMKIELDNLVINTYEFNHKVSKVDLRMVIFKSTNDIRAFLEYSTKLFTRSKVENMLKRYSDILGQIIRNKHIKISDIVVAHKLLTAESDVLQVFEKEFEF